MELAGGAVQGIVRRELSTMQKIRAHPAQSVNYLRNLMLNLDGLIKDAVLHHHEKPDGLFPEQMTGSEGPDMFPWLRWPRGPKSSPKDRKP